MTDTPLQPGPRRRMTRRELWNLIGVSAAAWVIVFALARIWWRVYITTMQ